MKQVPSLDFLSLALLLCSLLGHAQQTSTAGQGATVIVPPLVNFSGVLTDGNGKPLNGVVGVTFYLYKDSQGASPLWMETQNVQLDKTGHYKVMLGSATAQVADRNTRNVLDSRRICSYNGMQRAVGALVPPFIAREGDSMKKKAKKEVMKKGGKNGK